MDNSRIEQLREQLEEQQSYQSRVNGKEKGHWGNRLSGLAFLTMGGICYSASPLLGILSTPLAIDGLGDLITGQHHFVTYHLLKIHPKYEIAKLEKEIMLEMID